MILNQNLEDNKNGPFTVYLFIITYQKMSEAKKRKHIT